MPTNEMDKHDWVAEYAARILKTWQKNPGPLGIDNNYINELQNDLNTYYDDTLKRELIESTY